MCSLWFYILSSFFIKLLTLTFYLNSFPYQRQRIYNLIIQNDILSFPFSITIDAKKPVINPVNGVIMRKIGIRLNISLVLIIKR